MTDDIPDSGAVFTFGKSHFAENEPSHFFIKNDPVVAISCGDEHSAVICLNGRVFVFGGNAWGQLGLGHKDVVTRPTCVKWLKPQRAMFVACGRAHTVFVTDNNVVYSVGCNDEGQLGTGDMEQHTVPQMVELERDLGPIKQVSAGSNHTAILTECGRVFVCGSNSEGQLGLGEDKRSSLGFTELRFMEEIAFVECGYYHTVFITAKGAVFVTGDNENQRLGIPNSASTVYVPELIPIETAVKGACCGAHHTFLLSMDETKIIAFGSNDKGQLGMPKEIENVTKPTEIDMETMFDGYQLKLVACGAMHTAFVTDNGLLYTCGESRHNKLCLEDVDDADNSNDAPNQYLPKRVTAMNGHIVDNVACGGCHTLLTATKGSNADFTNNDFNVVNEDTRQISLTELPPLLKIPVMNITEDASQVIEDAKNSNADEPRTADAVNGNANEDAGSIDSLEANVSGSHIVNINDLEIETGSTHGVADIIVDEASSCISPVAVEVTNAIESMDTMADNMNTMTDKVAEIVEEAKKEVSDKVNEKVVVVEEVLKKTMAVGPKMDDEAKKVLDIPDKVMGLANSPPPKSPMLPEILHVPDILQKSPALSKHSDDGQKSENGQSENETIPCSSDKSSPQTGKTKTQAVMPIVRSEDHIVSQEDIEQHEEGVVMKEKGRFSRIFQSIKDKEHSCMGKGKVIEEKVVENVHKGLEGAEDTVHRIEQTVETEIRNQTNSRTCAIL